MVVVSDGHTLDSVNVTATECSEESNGMYLFFEG